MSFQNIYNFKGTLWFPGHQGYWVNTTTGMTVDAVGESAAIVGYVNLSSGPGTSKTISAAGSGKIHVQFGTNTYANASTNVRIGINDVGATGVEDGTHDVFKDCVPGTTTLTAGAVNAVTMGSGTKTIAHGDLIAVVVEMTARGGTDSIAINRTVVNSGYCSPWGTGDTGSGPAILTGAPCMAIEFDDGTIGWFDGHLPPITVASQTAYGSGSTPDEYALVFRLPFPARATGLAAWLANLASTDDFEMILYSDPLGTPVAQRTITQDADLCAVSGAYWSRGFSSAYDLSAGTDYGIALRPTTANTISLQALTLGTNGAPLRAAMPFGTNCSQYSRTDQTGAFGSQSTIVIPAFGIWLEGYDDATGGASGPVAQARIIQNIGTY